MKNIEDVLKTRENIIVSGNLGSGKTTNVMFPIVDKLIDNDESLIITDVNKEYINTFYNKLNDKEYSIKVISFGRSDNTDFFNLLTIPYNLYKNGEVSKSINMLDSLGDHLIKSNAAIDPFWDNSAKSLFIGTCLSLFKDGSEKEINLNSVMEILRLFEMDDYAKNYFESKKEIREIFLNVEPIIYAPKETKGGIISVLRQKLGLITSRETLSKVLSSNSINIDELSNRKTAIFIEMPDMASFYSVLVNATIRELYEVLKDSSIRYNFILDNVDILDNNKDLDYMLYNVGVNYKFYLGTRSFEVLKECCGKYIESITNLIRVSDNITISDYKIEEPLELEKYKVGIKTDIEYPVLSVEDISIFDAKDFVLKNVSVKESVSTEELIARIDKKIQELEKMESKEGQ